MTINFLDHFLLSQLASAALIFARIGGALMVMPGFGEVYVAPRIRLLLAISFSVLLVPMLATRMPALPASPLQWLMMLLAESMIGIFMGLVARAMLVAVHTAGNVIAMQSSLAVAAVFDPSSGGQNAVVSNILTLTVITLFFTMDMHHIVIAALVQSYDVFSAGQMPMVADMNLLHLRVMADAFGLGLALAAPHIVVSLLFYLVGGLMTRLMPNFQVFFVMMSPQILIAFFLLLALGPTILQVYMGFMENQLMHFVGGQP